MAIKIAVGEDGNPWIIKGDNSIFKWDSYNSQWIPYSGGAREIAIGLGNSPGAVFIVGCAPSDGNGNYYIYEAQGTDWFMYPNSQHPGSGIKIAACVRPWTIKADGSILQYDGYSWNPK